MLRQGVGVGGVGGGNASTSTCVTEQGADGAQASGFQMPSDDAADLVHKVIHSFTSCIHHPPIFQLAGLDGLPWLDRLAACLSCLAAWPGLAWPGLAWPGLAWAGLGWAGLSGTCLLPGRLSGWQAGWLGRSVKFKGHIQPPVGPFTLFVLRPFS